jgi:hypothetical protein
VYVPGSRGVGEAAIGDDIVGVLLKEEGRFLVGVVAHLDGVLGVISADAVDATNGKQVIAAANGQGRNRGRREDVWHCGFTLV